MWIIEVALWGVFCVLPVVCGLVLAGAWYLDTRDARRQAATQRQQREEAQKEKDRIEQLLVKTLEHVFSAGTASVAELKIFASHYPDPSTFVDVVKHCHFEVTRDQLLAAATEIFYRAQPSASSAVGQQRQDEKCQRYLHRIEVAFDKKELDGYEKLTQAIQGSLDVLGDMLDSLADTSDVCGQTVRSAKGLVRHVYKRKPFIFF